MGNGVGSCGSGGATADGAVRRRLGGTAHILMSATMLLHVVLARESLVAFWAEGILLASVLLGVTCRVSRGSEKVGAVEGLCQWAGVLVLLGHRLACAS